MSYFYTAVCNFNLKLIKMKTKLSVNSVGIFIIEPQAFHIHFLHSNEMRCLSTLAMVSQLQYYDQFVLKLWSVGN